MKNMPTAQSLSIVIPVFSALQETMDCVNSLLESDAKDCSIFLMDDGSEWIVQDRLRTTFAAVPNVTTVSHFRNRGYTRNISMGVAQTKTPFVCILNSDTLLPKIWSGPLLDKIKSDAHLAGIGPLSNAASYQSIPSLYDEVNGGFSENDGLGYDSFEREAVSQTVADFGHGHFVDVPILNGFCTIFRRSALDAIGGFDVASYPQGYGEENDLCVRLKAEGYRLVVDASVFVHHQKSKSFGSDRKKHLSELGSKTLAEKFGENFVPSLSEQLEKSHMLGSMRNLMRTIVEAGPRSLSDHQRMTIESRKTTVGRDAAPKLITLTGGASYVISPDMISPSSLESPNEIQLSANGDTVQINLPEGVDLTIFSSTPIATAFDALSLWSARQTIYLKDWAPGGEAYTQDGEVTVDWPAAWDMGDRSNLTFKQLSFSP